ncbi:hypothetical protein vseg_007129 [Gypsophila vaccaria]
MLLLRVAASMDLNIPIGRPGCRETCGNSTVKIPYPFGIGKNCYYNPWYEIVCNTTSGEQRPFLRKLNIEVLNITSCFDKNYSCPRVYLKMEVSSSWQKNCKTTTPGNSSAEDFISTVNLRGTPFRFSQNNVFFVKGCSGHANVVSHTKSLGGCSTTCEGGAASDVISSCNGLGCCSVLPTKEADYYQVEFSNQKANSCLEVGLVDWEVQDQIIQQIGSVKSFPTLLYWDPPVLSGGAEAYRDGSFNCVSYCDGDVDVNCTVCTCADSRVGNPYLPYGCQDSCKVGDTHSSSCNRRKWIAVFGVTACSIAVILLFCCFCLCKLLKRKCLVKQRAKHFKKNGGLLLKQQMISSEGAVDRTKLFTALELQKATDNFNANRILGQGAQGTVYKGMLLDGTVVAIKKSKKVDESQLEQFINEVVILSQINHRNIVKLLGCCLETEVPLLVYEYVSNGTLGHQLHSPSKESHISWNTRLQIAVESAEALTYLHSYSATPVYHRDIKSANILLDEKFRAKVSDFGTSRTITVDKTHMTTCVQGTLGYLDPEFFQTNQYTEKSDVYSFGVVLAELITGQKSLTPDGSGGFKSVAVEFALHMETSRLFDIIDSRISDAANKDEVMKVADIAMKCMDLNSKQRPKMKEAASELQKIRASNTSSEIKQENISVQMSKMPENCVSSSTFESQFSTDNVSFSTADIESIM